MSHMQTEKLRRAMGAPDRRKKQIPLPSDRHVGIVVFVLLLILGGVNVHEYFVSRVCPSCSQMVMR